MTTRVTSTRCRSCDAPILMVRTMKGRLMPLDEKLGANGNVRVREGYAFVLSGRELELAREGGEALRTSHFATCPDADQWRHR